MNDDQYVPRRNGLPLTIDEIGAVENCAMIAEVLDSMLMQIADFPADIDMAENHFDMAENHFEADPLADAQMLSGLLKHALGRLLTGENHPDAVREALGSYMAGFWSGLCNSPPQGE